MLRLRDVVAFYYNFLKQNDIHLFILAMLENNNFIYKDYIKVIQQDI
jgi:hypothetical protein